MDLVDLASRVGPILGFVVCITVVAELADGLGVFALCFANLYVAFELGPKS